MSRLLPVNYSGEKYGLTYRLVNEADANFIYKLRTDPVLSRYIHDVQGGVDGQVKWIRNYKKREEDGTDYYFLFFLKDQPIGLFRLYSIHDKTFTSGSWVMVPGTPSEYVLAVPMIIRELAFETLGFEFEDNYDATHIDNKKVIKFNKWFGCKIYKHFMDVKGEYVAMSLTKEDFEANKPKLLKMINTIL